MPEKKKTIMVDEYWERGEHKRQDKAQLDVECEEEEEEALQKLNEMRRLNQEDWERMVKMKEMKEQEEKARRDTAKAAQ